MIQRLSLMWVVWGIAGLLLGTACSSENTVPLQPPETPDSINHGTDSDIAPDPNRDTNIGTNSDANNGVDTWNTRDTNNGSDSGAPHDSNSDPNPPTDSEVTNDSEGNDPVDCDAGGDCWGACWGCALEGPCAAQNSACASQAQCKSLQACLSPTCDVLSGDQWQACYDNCVAQNPAGAQPLQALWSCIYCDACASSCDSVGFDCTPHTPDMERPVNRSIFFRSAHYPYFDA
ncbi:MAG: MSCRAMM family adhesin SdrC [Proteobacteria bacterium]|nr:MSCRAMM family adhesin SdrC [Pseudomonadota bacterium]